MNIPGFTPESLAAVGSLLYAEENPYKGKCGQKELRKRDKQQRTPAQQDADRERAQANRGQDNIPSATRSEAAKKAVETRRKCKGQPSTSTPQQP